MSIATSNSEDDKDDSDLWLDLDNSTDDDDGDSTGDTREDPLVRSDTDDQDPDPNMYRSTPCVYCHKLIPYGHDDLHLRFCTHSSICSHCNHRMTPSAFEDHMFGKTIKSASSNSSTLLPSSPSLSSVSTVPIVPVVSTVKSVSTVSKYVSTDSKEISTVSKDVTTVRMGKLVTLIKQQYFTPDNSVILDAAILQYIHVAVLVPIVRDYVVSYRTNVCTNAWLCPYCLTIVTNGHTSMTNHLKQCGTDLYKCDALGNITRIPNKVPLKQCSENLCGLWFSSQEYVEHMEKECGIRLPCSLCNEFVPLCKCIILQIYCLSSIA